MFDFADIHSGHFAFYGVDVPSQIAEAEYAEFADYLDNHTDFHPVLDKIMEGDAIPY